MTWLNFHHLFYFWRIAREGGLARAATSLRLSHSTLSTQLKALEESLDGALFERRGRRLVLTPLGEQVASYADDIFRLGREVMDVAKSRGIDRRSSLRAGIVTSLPKSIAFQVVLPGLGDEPKATLFARQGDLDVLVGELASGRLHLVLSDTIPSVSPSRRVFAHPLGESNLLFYGTPELAARHRHGFPQSMMGAPVLLPAPGTGLRIQLDRWLAEQHLRVRIAGEFDDAGLMRIAGARGLGLLPVRAALRAEVEDGHGMDAVGELEGVVERYYVLSAERRVSHPGVTAILARGRAELAAPSRRTRAPRGHR